VGVDNEPGSTAAASLPMLPQTTVGLVLSGHRRGDLFALGWKDIDEQARLLTVREAALPARKSLTPHARGR